VKRVGVVQSNYIPWRGYFDFIASVDLFVVYDDVQYSKNTWRNRNLIKTRRGMRWLTVPVKASIRLSVDQVMIGAANKPWQEYHRHLLRESLGDAPFFKDAIRIWDEGIAHHDVYLSPLNVRLIRSICSYLGIRTPIVMSRDYDLTGAKTERLMQLLKKVGAAVYLSGPAARGYLDESLFRENGIGLEYKTYDYAPYPQLWGEFAGTVTILDLIANLGPESRGSLKSLTSHRISVP
jgi:hypothetical protein